MKLNGSEKHVMLSYNHKSKDIVKVVCNMLVAKNVPVWFDERDIDDDLYDSMADAINNADVVCCFITPEYENSSYCKLELKHAHKLGKRIIPCMISDRNIWKASPSQWLDLITGSLIDVDFSDCSGENIRIKVDELISRIKRCQTLFHDTVQSIASPTKLFEIIRQKYLKDDRMKRVVNEEKCFPIEQSYINLAIVESKEQQEKEKKLKEDTENTNIVSMADHENLGKYDVNILGTYEEIYGAKEAINIKDILKKCRDSVKRVLMLGRAGIGKSTFCRYVSYQWAKGQLWSEYELLVTIQLRSLSNTRFPPGSQYSPVDIIQQEYSPFNRLSDVEKKYIEERCKNGKVLWILDGYDEFVVNTPDQLKDFFQYVYDTQHHILTSRPYVIAMPYDVKMEITGFTDDNIPKYVGQFFDQIKSETQNASVQGQNLLTFLSSNSSIWGVAHIPVNLELICTLWGDNNWSTTKILTMTTLYDNMVEWLCRRNLIRQGEDYSLSRKSAIYERCSAELQFLEVLAFEAMESDTIILPPTLLVKAENETGYSLDKHPELLNIGILKSYDDKATGTQIPTKLQHYFVHLSFQEHFAARYLLRLLKSSQKHIATNFINAHRYNQRFFLVFVFASGLLTQTEYTLCTEMFWTLIQAEPMDLIGIKHIQLIIACIEESGERLASPQYRLLLASICQWIDIYVKSQATVIRENILQTFKRARSLGSNSIIQKKLIKLMEAHNAHIKQSGLQFFSNIGVRDPSKLVLDKILTALEDEDSDVRRAACEALEKVSGKSVTTEIITNLTKALRDEDEWVRRAACEALGKISDKAETNDFVTSLIHVLQDENKWVRIAACEALGKLGAKIATSVVRIELINAIRNQELNISYQACEALINIFGRAAMDEVMTNLIYELRSEDKCLRRATCEILQNIDGNMLTDEVISSLLKALKDEDDCVRKEACTALGNIGDKVATNEVITSLMNALRDEASSVGVRACKALGNIGEKSTTSEIILALIDALHNQDEWVKSTVCEVLGNIGGKTLTNMVIGSLINAVQHENSRVKVKACQALGKIGNTAVTYIAVTDLMRALQDDDEWVRRAACEALGHISRSTDPIEIIDCLFNALWDESQWVRSTACEGLGNVSGEEITTKVVASLMNALQDDVEWISIAACEALGRIGEKAPTKIIISALVEAIMMGKLDMRCFEVRVAFEQAMSSYKAVKELDSVMIARIFDCIKHEDFKFSKMSTDHFMKIFLTTENLNWAPVVAYTALVQGVAVTMTGKSITIYDNRGQLQFQARQLKLVRTLAKAFRNLKNELQGDIIITNFQKLNLSLHKQRWWLRHLTRTALKRQ